MLKTLLLLSSPLLFIQSASPVIAQAAKEPIVIVITVDGFPARALQDPRLPMPTLRALAASGAVASGMKPINPTVTWPNHTALITGVNASEHYVMANGLIDLPADHSQPHVLPWVDKDKLVHARTLYEAATEKGMTTAQVDWVAIYGAKGLNWIFGEKPDVHDSIPQELIANGTVTREQIEHFGENSSPAWRDQIFTDAAIDIIERHQPRLLLMHLLQSDSIQHEYAPLTKAAFTAYAYADSCIARIIEATRKAGLLDRTTFFILSDHGFDAYTHVLNLNVAFAQKGYLHKQNGKWTGDVWGNSEGGADEVYIAPNRRAELLPVLKSYLATLPGVEHVYTNEEAQALGLPSDKNTDQAPQLYVTAVKGYSFENDVEGSLTADTSEPKGAHGYLNGNYEMQALFVASGAAIRPGVKLDAIPNLRVAPTIAQILGLSLPDAKQPALNEILR
ncbi:MAG TPA: ectonucleotide pyrophosphatase/phosphodiesterase [Edaphobacter sp.]